MSFAVNDKPDAKSLRPVLKNGAGEVGEEKKHSETYVERQQGQQCALSLENTN